MTRIPNSRYFRDDRFESVSNLDNNLGSDSDTGNTDFRDLSEFGSCVGISKGPMLIRKERSIPWTREYRFERAIPPLLSAYLASRLSGHFSGDLLKLHFFTNEATPVFNGRSKKYTPMVDTNEREKKKTIRSDFFPTFVEKSSFSFFFQLLTLS